MSLLRIDSPNPPPRNTPFMSRYYNPDAVEWLKMVLGAVTLLPIRVVLAVCIYVVAWAFGVLLTMGAPKHDKDGHDVPLSPPRRRLASYLAWLCSRAMLVTLGYYRVVVKGSCSDKVLLVLVRRYQGYSVNPCVAALIKNDLFLFLSDIIIWITHIREWSDSIVNQLVPHLQQA